MTTPYLLQLGDRIRRGLARRPAEGKERHRLFLLSRQTADGGFAGRDVDLNGQPVFEAAPESDLYYTSFAVRGLDCLSEFDPATAARVAGYLKRGRASSVIDLTSWLYSALVVQAASDVDVLAEAAVDWPVRLAAQLETFRTPDGGYAKTHEGASGSTYHSFLVAVCYELLAQTLPQPERLVAFIRQRQRDDGGFVEIAPMRKSGTNPTAAAVAILKMFAAVDDEVREGVADFLTEVRGTDGGFQANTRVPFSDALSTFTALVTCLDLGLNDAIQPHRLERFLSALEFPTGGFRAAEWDATVDVEYTFYALGVQGLLASGIT